MEGQLRGYMGHKEASHRTLVTFCGAPAVAKACYRGIADANHLATMLGRPYKVDFREEFYGVASAQLKKKKRSGRRNLSSGKKLTSVVPPARVLPSEPTAQDDEPSDVKKVAWCEDVQVADVAEEECIEK